MKRFTGTYFDLAVLAGMGFIPLLWFRDGYNALAGFDFAVYLNPVDTLTRSFYLWSDRMAGGYDISHEISSLPYYFLFSFPILLGASFYTAEKFVFIVIFALQGLSMYYMLRALFERQRASRVMALSGAILYSFNFPVMAHFGRGNMMALLAYGLLPLLLGLIHKGFTAKDKGWKYITLIAFLSLPVSAVKGHPADFVVLMGVAMFFITFNLATAKRERALHILLFTLKAGAASMAVNLWWIIPNIVYLRDFGLSNSDLVSEGFYNLDTLDYYSSGTSILNIFRNERLDLWFDIPSDALFNPELYKHPVFIAIGLLLPAAAFLAIIKGRGNRHIFFFSVLGLVAVFMSKGSHEPFGDLFRWMFLKVPGFFFFRAPYRVFSSLYTFSIVPLLAYMIGGLAGKRAVAYESEEGLKINARVLKNVSIGLFIFTFLTVSSAYAWPVFTGAHLRERGTLREPGVFQNIPREYALAEEWLHSQKDGFKIYYPYEIYDSNTGWGYNGPDPSFELLTAPKVVSRPGGTVYVRYQKPIEALNKVFWSWRYGDLGKVLAAYNIRYALLHDDFNPWVMPSYNFNDYARSLFEVNGFEVKERIGPLVFFENSKSSARIYGTNKGYILSGDESSFPCLSLAGFMDSPFLVFTKDITPEGLDKITGGVNGIIFHDSNVIDAVCSIFEKKYGVSFTGYKYKFKSGSGEFAVFLKNGPAAEASMDGKRLERRKTNEGVAWKSAGMMALGGGEHILAYSVPAKDSKIMVVPFEEFKRTGEKLKAFMSSEKSQVVYLLDKDQQAELNLRGTNEYAVERYIPVKFDRDIKDALGGIRVWKDITHAGGKIKAESVPLDIDTGKYPVFTFKTPKIDFSMTFQFDLDGRLAEFSLDKSELSEGKSDLNDRAKKAFGPAGFYRLKKIRIDAATDEDKTIASLKPALAGEFGVLQRPCEMGSFGELLIDNQSLDIENRTGCGRWESLKNIGPGDYGVVKENRPGASSIVMIRKTVEKKSEALPEVGFTRLDPARYEVSASARKGDKLVFSDSFNKGWNLFMNGKKYETVKVNGYANGFMLEEDAKGDFVLEYAPQRIFGYSKAASVIALAGVVAAGRRKTKKDKGGHV